MPEEPLKYYLTAKDINALNQLRTRLSSYLTMLNSALADLGNLLERAEAPTPQPRKRANLKQARKDALDAYILNKGRKTKKG